MYISTLITLLGLALLVMLVSATTLCVVINKPIPARSTDELQLNQIRHECRILESAFYGSMALTLISSLLLAGALTA